MKIVSWNVNGLRAVLTKGFYESMAKLDADVICLQEIKMQKGQCDVELPGYEQVFYCADKKGYSGTAVFSRAPMKSVSCGIGIDEHDHEGRAITCEFEDFYLVCCYTPNSQNELKRLDYRMRWEDDFREYLQRLAGSKPVITCGDFNVAHKEIDLKNPKTNRRNAGFTDEEREKMTALQEAKNSPARFSSIPSRRKRSFWSVLYQRMFLSSRGRPSSCMASIYPAKRCRPCRSSYLKMPAIFRCPFLYR